MSAPKDPGLTRRIDACLPQTQCTRCGFPHCRGYAEAIARHGTDINRCPPGGETTIAALAALLGIAAKPLDPACGEHRGRTRAEIDESACIGCRRCLDVCPVDAIVGARGYLHTVIAANCTGCELCLPACPVDCIGLAPTSVRGRASTWPEYGRAETERWRALAERRMARRRARPALPRRASAARPSGDAPGREQIRAEIRAAVERVRGKRVSWHG